MWSRNAIYWVIENLLEITLKFKWTKTYVDQWTNFYNIQ